MKKHWCLMRRYPNFTHPRDWMISPTGRLHSLLQCPPCQISLWNDTVNILFDALSSQKLISTMYCRYIVNLLQVNLLSDSCRTEAGNRQVVWTLQYQSSRPVMFRQVPISNLRLLY
jgi:hypothetical protein